MISCGITGESFADDVSSSLSVSNAAIARGGGAKVLEARAFGDGAGGSGGGTGGASKRRPALRAAANTKGGMCGSVTTKVAGRTGRSSDRSGGRNAATR